MSLKLFSYREAGGGGGGGVEVWGFFLLYKKQLQPMNHKEVQKEEWEEEVIAMKSSYVSSSKNRVQVNPR